VRQQRAAMAWRAALMPPGGMRNQRSSLLLAATLAPLTLAAKQALLKITACLSGCHTHPLDLVGRDFLA
jgi:hypothetical protein